jgi:hypothetical protein
MQRKLANPRSIVPEMFMSDSQISTMKADLPFGKIVFVIMAALAAIVAGVFLLELVRRKKSKRLLRCNRYRLRHSSSYRKSQIRRPFTAILKGTLSIFPAWWPKVLKWSTTRFACHGRRLWRKSELCCNQTSIGYVKSRVCALR